MVRSLLKSAVFILFGVVVLFEIVGTTSADWFMFHPVKGGYAWQDFGVVDIGTNGVAIAASYRAPAQPKKVLLYCHGNGEDLTSAVPFEPLMAHGIAVAAVDYPDYGLSGGRCSEAGCYRVVHRLYDWLIAEKGFKPQDIVVFGFSIGTGPAVELASTRPVGGLVLQAAFLSAPRVVTQVRLLPIDPFPSLKRIGQVKCPLLMLHGTADRVVPYDHGKKLFALAREPKRFIAVEGADHNEIADVLEPVVYLRELGDFILPASRRL